MDTITRYRPTAKLELDLVATSGCKQWPPRLPGQPIFHLLTSEQYAIELAQWNVTDFGAGYVSKFEVNKKFMDSYPIKCVGAKHHNERCLPAEDLNNNIVGSIEVIGEYKKPLQR